MKKKLLILIVFMFGMVALAQAQTNVTFWVNTSTVPDTITERANIQLRGDPAPLTWDNATGGQLTNIGGDYWTVTLSFEPGAELRFKLFADSENDGETGWESNVGTGSTNREFTVPATDTTLPLIFYNTVDGRDQWYTPFADDDSVDVLFRVNMAGFTDYNAATMDVGVRGGVAPLDWGTSILLTPEVPAGNTGQINYAPASNFLSGVIKFPADTADVPYQFVASAKGDPSDGGAVWENSLGGFDGNRSLPLNAMSPDSTLYWKWFGDIAPIDVLNKDTVVVTYNVDVTKAIQGRGFAHGDTLEARSGYFGTTNSIGGGVRMLRQGFSNLYSGTDTVVTTRGGMLDYQYYLVKNGADVRENFYDFVFTGEPASRAERRRIDVTGSTLTINDNEESQLSARRQPTFPNQSTLARNVLVNWEVDMRPAIFQVLAGDTLQDIQGDFDIFQADSILAWGVWMNGPAVGGWSNTGGDWGLGLSGNDAKKLYDDGTNGDRVAGDSVFTRQVLASPDSINMGSKGRVGQTYKFGIRGGDNEAGSGGFGNNHVANIDDSGPTFTLYTQFGSINPAFYDAWDFDNRRPAEAQPVNVTFWVNTSTVPDTITERANIQLRGDPAPLTWDNATGGKLTNVSGDYWTTTLQFMPGAELRFKIFADSENDGDTGWEANSGTGSTNREYTVPNSDVTLPLIFYNTVDGRDQWYTPFADDDSVDVLFRVNMAGFSDYNAATLDVGVRGGVAPLDWGASFLLTPEVASANTGQLNYPAGNFLSGVLRFPADVAEVPYQFVTSNKTDPTTVVTWENSLPGLEGNRMLPLTAMSPDTTLYWQWFGNVPPLFGTNPDTVLVTYNVDVTRAIQSRGFSHGDTLEARSGYFASGNDIGRAVRLLRQGFSNLYSATDTVVATKGKMLDYQYYLVKNNSDVRENYYDFVFTGDPASRAERRRIDVTGNTLTINDTEDSQLSARRQPTFPNQSTLARNVLVNWEVDMRPAIFQVLAGDTLSDIQGDFDIFQADSILAWGVWMNGPAVGGWSNTGGDWGLGLAGNEAKKLYDDGTNGDRVAGDSVFTRQVLASPDSINMGSKGRVGQTYKFGIRGGDNEAGSGGFGNNHVANIDDSGPTFTLYTQFGSINPAFYDAWDFDKRKPIEVGVRLTDANIPTEYALGQNYPNPFNPSTTIRYAITQPGPVKLVLFNTLGQQIAELVNEPQQPGTYEVTVDFAEVLAKTNSSGQYFYQLRAGKFVQTRAMTLIK